MTANPTREAVAKGLVWRPASGPDALCHDHWTASAISGAYHTAPDEDSSIGAWLMQWTIRPDDFCMKYGGEITRHSSPDAAQAAAQTDYESRIRSALADHVLPDQRFRDGVKAAGGRLADYSAEITRLTAALSQAEQQLTLVRGELANVVAANGLLMKRDGEARAALRVAGGRLYWCAGLLSTEKARDLASEWAEETKSLAAALADLPANEGEKI